MKSDRITFLQTLNDNKFFQSAQSCIATLYSPLITLVLDNVAEFESAAKTDPQSLSPTGLSATGKNTSF